MWDKVNQWEHLQDNLVYSNTTYIIIAGGVLDLVAMGGGKDLEKNLRARNYESVKYFSVVTHRWI